MRRINKRARRSVIAGSIWVAAGLALTVVSASHGAVFTVDVLNDGMDADPTDGLCQTSTGDCTLRAAIQQSETAFNPPHKVLLPLFGTYTLDICCDLEDAGAAGDLDLNAPIEIVGISPAATIIQQTVDDRVFHCEPSSGFNSVALRNLTITGGIFLNTQFLPPRDGGGLLLRQCHHTLDNVVVDGNLNSSTGVGCNVAVFNSNSVIKRSTLANGDGACKGGGLYLQNGAQFSALIEESTIHSNGYLDGIYLLGDLTIRNSTLSENGPPASSNAANIILEGAPTLTLEHVTLVQHGQGTNIRFDDSHLGGTMTIKNSLLQHHSQLDNCHMGIGGITISEGYNIDSSNNCQLTSLTDSINTDALLSPFRADHGGPTVTHDFTTTGSPAIDYIPSIRGHCNGAGLPADQRGAPRVADCEAGAYESLGCPNLALSNEMIFGNTEYHECAITVGPEVLVIAPSGQLTLTTGTSVRFEDGFAIEDGGELAVFHNPALELVLPELVAAEMDRRSLSVPDRQRVSPGRGSSPRG